MKTLISSSGTDVEPRRVVIVGGGAAGVITAVHLLRRADPDDPVDVRIIEKAPAIGPGLAYRTGHPLHTLNNFAGRLSAIDGDPDHLLRWCARRGIPASPTSFPARREYGRYLSDLLDEVAVPAGSSLRRTRGEVVDIRDSDRGLEVHLSGGWQVQADAAVLALGNPPPRPQPAVEALARRYVGNPWDHCLADELAGADRVLLLGTGLTMVDVVAELHQANPKARFTAVSRHGWLPTPHLPGAAHLHDTFHPGAAALETLQRRLHERIREVEDAGGGWRDVVDSVRGHANELWRGLSKEDQDRFVTRLSRRWDVVRHRMSPAMHDLVCELRSTGLLRVARVAGTDPADFDAVVNCTGPAPVPSRGWSRLVDTLLERGSIRPHRLGRGLDLDVDGRVRRADGTPPPRLYAIGAARRGIEWEVTAIPDLRQQAVALAAHLAAAKPLSQHAAGSVRTAEPA